MIIIILVGILLFAPAEKSSEQNPPTGISGIEITSPKINEEISSPLKITGIVNGGGWGGFEGQVGTVKLIDSKGEQLGQTVILSATTDWMKAPISFEANLDFVSSEPQNGTLTFYNENPSGLIEYDKQFSLPIKFSKNKTIEVSVFFGIQHPDAPEYNCQEVIKISRYIGETPAVAQAAINQLLSGPTDAEKAQGYFTNIPSGSKLNSISVVNGVVKADFNKATESGGGSCSMAARVAQITKTLMQFPTITSVELSIDGRTGDIFQP